MRRKWFVWLIALWAALLLAGWVWYFASRMRLFTPAPDDLRDVENNKALG